MYRKCLDAHCTLLTVGATLTLSAFLLQFIYAQHQFLAILLVAIPIAGFFVLREFGKLYSLSKEYVTVKSDDIEKKIVQLSARNPKWIMIITQTYSIISIILLVSKFLL